MIKTRNGWLGDFKQIFNHAIERANRGDQTEHNHEFDYAFSSE
jgi:hypothetical protein